MTDYGDCAATVRYEVDGIERLYKCDRPTGHVEDHHDNFAGLDFCEPWMAHRHSGS
jgi:hypothetical protein